MTGFQAATGVDGTEFLADCWTVAARQPEAAHSSSPSGSPPYGSSQHGSLHPQSQQGESLLAGKGREGGRNLQSIKKQRNLVLAYEKMCFSLTLPPFFLQHEPKNKGCRFSVRGKKSNSLLSILSNQSFNRFQCLQFKLYVIHKQCYESVTLFSKKYTQKNKYFSSQQLFF